MLWNMLDKQQLTPQTIYIISFLIASCYNQKLCRACRNIYILNYIINIQYDRKLFKL